MANEIFSGNVQSKEGFAPQQSKREVQVSKCLILAVHYSCWSVVIASALLNIVLPTSPQFLSSLITTNSVLFTIFGRLIAIILQVYLIAWAVQMIPVVVSSMNLVMFTMPAVVRQLM